MAKGNKDAAGSQPGAGETREERLARQLRENLRRRKSQARALKHGGEPQEEG